MSGNNLPADVLDFLIEHIHSIEQLEILLLLRDNRERFWYPKEVNDIVRSSIESVTNRLEDLYARGFLSRLEDPAPCYGFAPKDAQLEAAISAVALVYKERRTKVIEFIFSRPAREIHSFSKAFKFRKDS